MRHEPFCKQLEARSSFLCGNHNGHHNSELIDKKEDPDKNNHTTNTEVMKTRWTQSHNASFCKLPQCSWTWMTSEHTAGDLYDLLRKICTNLVLTVCSYHQFNTKNIWLRYIIIVSKMTRIIHGKENKQLFYHWKKGNI